MSDLFREAAAFARYQGEEAFCVFCLKPIASGDCCDKCAKEIDPPNGYPEEPA